VHSKAAPNAIVDPEEESPPFLVTTVFPKDEGLAVVLPRSDDVVDVAPANILQFVVLESGVVEVRRGGEPRGEMVPASGVAAAWRVAFASNDRLVALVRTHPDAPYRSMIDVLDGLAEARAPRISLQVLAER
jgi:biopolymer transport protein ExbD